MLQGVGVWLLTLVIAMVVVNFVGANHKTVDKRFLIILFFYHTALAIAYYVYAVFNPSDSRQYYQNVSNKRGGETWFEFAGAGTDFIEFLAYPFIHGLGFTYESCMMLFAF